MPIRLVPRTTIARTDLTDPVVIVARMTDDLRAAHRDGRTGPIDLTALGWTLAQVQRWGAAARARVRDDLCRAAVARACLGPGAGEPPAEPLTADTAAVVAATLAADAVDPLERIGRALGNDHLVAGLFGLAFYGALWICLMEPVG
jgi:hypothetical protein